MASLLTLAQPFRGWVVVPLLHARVDHSTDAARHRCHRATGAVGVSAPIPRATRVTGKGNRKAAALPHADRAHAELHLPSLLTSPLDTSITCRFHEPRFSNSPAAHFARALFDQDATRIRYTKSGMFYT